MRNTIKNSPYKIVYNQCNRTNQWYFIIVDKCSDKRVGSSYNSFKEAESYLLDNGLVENFCLFPVFESNIV